MNKAILLVFLLLGIYQQTLAQGQPLSYYLPGETFDSSIPTPESVLGFPVGEWHVSHDQLVYYMRAVAAASERVQIQEYARSHEGRPLVMLTISSIKNLAKLEDIKKQHQLLSDTDKSADINLDQLPAVILQGYSVHGNESSGANAALVVAYRLAASQSQEVAELLDNVVVLLDPCFNPDGFHRFSTWANMHKSLHTVANPDSREFNEVWPGGRTNHYWFDLNRDWLMAVHPESQGRLRIFQEWLPNILTDHHEMGSDATFFFQPGIPSRTNPNTPALNQELTKKIGTYHAAQLDQLGSLYYTEESYDDFYYGKGSTYPDVQGSVGILFEQASSRGHTRDTENGQMTFAFTIRNQVAASISTQKAAVAMRRELLAYKRDFFKNGLAEAKKLDHAAYVFGESRDQSRLAHFVELLHRHQIDIYALDKDINSDGKIFQKGQAYVVPLLQKQTKLIQSIFEQRTSFTDSLFYDVSAWTIPLAYNLDFAAVDAKALATKGKKVSSHEYSIPDFQQSNYAYLMDWDDYDAPRVLNKLMEKGIRVKVAQTPFRINVGDRERDFQRGTILIPVQNLLNSTAAEMANNSATIYLQLRDIASQEKVTFYTADSGLSSQGIDLGSRNFELLHQPKVLLVGGDGVSAYDAGEVWHLLDRRYAMPPVIVEVDRLERIQLSNYNSIVMVSGSYGSISDKGVDALKGWVQQGGVLTLCGNAIRWAESKGLAKVTFKSKSDDGKDKTVQRRPYAKQSADSGADLISGAIFQTELDLTHPLTYGFSNKLLPVFRRGAMIMDMGKNPYSTPAVYTTAPLLAGYASRKNQEAIAGSAAISVTAIGSGRVIALADNPNFRGFWLGTNKVFANALFFGHTIGRGMCE